METNEIISLLKEFTLVYFFLIFCGILFWTFRRKNREVLESHKDMPFRED